MTAPLVVQNLTISYNRIPAVHHADFKLPPGSCTGLLGPNGAGKTTLLKALAGLLPYETGSISLGELDWTPANRRRHRHLLAYVPQREAVDWDFPITVRALVEMGRYPALGCFRPFSRADHEMVDRAIALTGLEEFADRQIRKLSGGQQQRAFLARAWAQQSAVYLLDEPFTGLDREAKATFAHALHHLRDEGRIVLASHHQLEEVPAFFDHVLLLNGELVASGPTPETFSPALLEKTYSVRVFSGHHHHPA